VNGQGHLTFESVLILLTKNYQNWSKLQLGKVGAFFETVYYCCQNV